jgi:hypothetical protein
VLVTAVLRLLFWNVILCRLITAGICVITYAVRSSLFWDFTLRNIPTTVPWPRRLVAGLSPRRPGFDPGSVYVGFWWTKWHWDRSPPPVLRFSSQFHSTGAPLRYAHTGAQRTERTDVAHGDKIFFPLLVTCHRTLIRTGRNGVRQFRLGFWEGNLFPSGQRVWLTQRWSWSYRIAWCDTEGKMLVLLANQRPALKWIASARRRKYDAVCLLSKNIATRPTRPFLPLRSSVRVPLLGKIEKNWSSFFSSSSQGCTISLIAAVHP